MSTIAWFCIPANGHTNPTLGVVSELVARGHEVRYYSYEPMRERIEAAGARFISCDKYDMQMELSDDDNERIGTDIAFSTDIIVNTTLALDDGVLADLRDDKPDVIVGDSVAFWAKLIAKKLGVPFVSSTTTFAFNKYSSQEMGQGIKGLFRILAAMPHVNRSLKRLRDKGYPVKGIMDVIANDNDTDTIVFTSLQFQPYAETFSKRYAFVGPSMRAISEPMEKPDVPLVYISLGTVVNKRPDFYRHCIEACADAPFRVVMAVGDRVDREGFGALPANIEVFERTDQMAVLNVADVFLTHCGMNSANEALWFGVPLILYPQTSEQQAVANRAHELGAGVFLQADEPDAIRTAIDTALSDASYKKAADSIAQGFHACGGTREAADKIESAIA